MAGSDETEVNNKESKLSLARVTFCPVSYAGNSDQQGWIQGGGRLGEPAPQSGLICIMLYAQVTPSCVNQLCVNQYKRL